MTSKLRIGILVTGAPPGALAETYGSYPDMFRRLLGETEFAYQSFDVRAAPPPAVDACAAYVITGSPAGAYDQDLWIGQLRDFLAAAKNRAALVGICFGHQLMAEAFGGRVEKSSKGWGIGLHGYAVRTPEPWMRPGPVISAPASHQDQVSVLPPAARVLAASEFSEHGMLAYDDQPAISIQLHPEFDPGYAKALIEARRGRRYAEDFADRALASLDGPNDCARLGLWISNFVRERRPVS
jgi:GMP synthase-like glutamine amidotransferase